MTLRELFDMARQYGLAMDAELAVRPLLKDKVRKVTNVVTGVQGQILLVCNREKTDKPTRTKNLRIK